MKKEYSGRTSSHAHKFDDWKSKDCNGCQAIQKATIIEAQWSNMPIEVYEEVADLWRWMEFGNDYYYYHTSVEELKEMQEDSQTDFYEDRKEKLVLDYLFQWLDENGFKGNQRFLLHFWW